MTSQPPALASATPAHRAIVAAVPRPVMELNLRDGLLPAATTFTRASSAGYWNSSGTWTIAGNNVPRFEHDPVSGGCLGLLMEESRTNYLRNNTMAGAATGTLGSGGTLPTYWSLSGQGTLTATVVATGTEFGLEYLDLRLNGTTSTPSTSLALETTTGTATSSAVVWIASTYLRRISGSMTNINGIRLNMLRDGGSTVASGADVKSNLDAGRPFRAVTQGTSPSGATFMWPVLTLETTTPASVDITLRIYTPQFERGGFVTSVIKTSGITTTRSADIHSQSLTAGLIGDQGTLVCSTVAIGTQVTGNGKANMAALTNGTPASRVAIRGDRANLTLGGAVTVSTAILAVMSSATWVSHTVQRGAIGWKTNDFGCAVNGGTLLTDTDGTMTTLNVLTLGRSTSNTDYFSGYVQYVAIYDQRLENDMLRALSEPV